MAKPLKILLVHLYSNGDCLYATSVARQIKKDFPGCDLTWAIAGFCKSIIANNPYVDHIMEVNEVAKNDVNAFREFKKEILKWKKDGKFDEVFITHNIDTNLAFYDGSIRSGILRAYPHTITVPVQPVLRLYPEEIDKARAFAETHGLHNYSQVLLFEYAPQSKQVNISKKFSLTIAEKLANDTIAVILSSSNKVEHPDKNIIDGSALTLRETAALTHYCTMLLGCSSGITWISTSNAAKQLPMVQLVNPGASWSNIVSRDFKMFGIDDSKLIEITDWNESKIITVVKEAMDDFYAAKNKNTPDIPLHFKTTRKIIYNLLCYFEFSAIATHIRINRQVYGDNISFYAQVFLGFITAPFTLVKNIFIKKILKKK